MNENMYRCKNCGWEGELKADHCPHCLSSVHSEDSEGYECLGTLQPVSILVDEKGNWDIVSRCSRCGELVSYPVCEEDNPLVLLSIASRPLAMPPFPIEKTEELTLMMGGQGDMEGYYEQGN